MASKINQAIVLAHFHKSGKVRSDTLNFLKNCHNKFKRIIFVSTNILPEELAKIPSFVECHVRENIGYDFFSYRLGLEKLREDTCRPNDDERKIHLVTLINTSILIFDSNKFINQYFTEGIELLKYHFSGLTISPVTKNPGGTVLIPPHLQSFLLSFSHQVLSNQKVLRWWRRLYSLNEKELIIKKYEISLSQYLAMQGFMPTAIYQRPNNFKMLDPCQEHYQEILDQYSVLKINLIKFNQFKMNLSAINKKIATDQNFMNLIIEGLEN